MSAPKPDITAPGSILVVGMGISGQAVCELLLRQGVRVTATDLRAGDQFKGALDALKAQGCRLRLGGHALDDFLEADQIVVSPGVPLDLPPLKAARDKGIEIVGEFEWAWRQVSGPVVAVTGTNGKTTTTSLIGKILEASGKRVFVGGNIGTPLSRWLLHGDAVDAFVLEVSSFQLDTAPRFRPDVGVLLNVTEDHLDRYESFSAYADSKFSLFARQTPRDTAVLNADDPLCLERASGLFGKTLLYSRKRWDAHATIQDHRVRVNLPWGETFEFSIERALLKGVHNEENIMAAALAASALEIAPSVIQEAVEGYRGLPHRLEWVRTWRGIDFFDDSKGTNVGAVVKALENFDRPVWLLLGGRDKLGSYAPLVEVLKGKGRGALVFGEAGPRMQKELEAHIPTWSFTGLEGALQEAIKRAEPGDVVLLSPACSSFDQYESYAKRGDHFKRLVNRLAEATAEGPARASFK